MRGCVRKRGNGADDEKLRLCCNPQKKWGVRGVHPLGCLPLLRERGGHPPNSRYVEANHKKKGFQQRRN